MDYHKWNDFLTDNTNFRTLILRDSLYNKNREQTEKGVL